MLLFLSIFISQNIYCQYKFLKTKSSFGIPVKNNNAKYVKYPDNYVFSKECIKQVNCRNSTPEETLISVFSSDNYEWDQSNYNYKISQEPNKYKLKQQIKVAENNFKLLRKLEFSIEEEQYSIIKYYVKENLKLIPLSGVFKKEGSKWLLIMPENSMTKLDLMFSYLSVKALDAVFLNQKTSVLSFDAKISSFYNKNILNLTECMNYSPNEKMTPNDLNIIIDELVINPSSSNTQAYNAIKFKEEDLIKFDLLINYVKEIENQKLMYYIDDSYSNSIIDNELINYEGVSFIDNKPLLKYNYSYNFDDYSIVKYEDVNRKRNVKKFVKKEDKWIVSQDDRISESIKIILLNNEIDFFKMIFSSKMNSKINMDFKDENNVINIEKVK